MSILSAAVLSMNMTTLTLAHDLEEKELFQVPLQDRDTTTCEALWLLKHQKKIFKEGNIVTEEAFKIIQQHGPTAHYPYTVAVLAVITTMTPGKCAGVTYWHRS